MAKFQSPLLGYNNNVRHRGRVFHIQTEDSGVNHPHIITHLFMDGGRILKSVKKSYAEHVGTDNMSETVRVLMKEQHKAMFIALRDGQFDELAFGAKKPSGALAAPVVPAAAPDTKREEAPAAPPGAEASGAREPSVEVTPPAPGVASQVVADPAVKVASDPSPSAPEPPIVESRPGPTAKPGPPRPLPPEETHG